MVEEKVRKNKKVKGLVEKWKLTNAKEKEIYTINWWIKGLVEKRELELVRRNGIAGIWKDKNASQKKKIPEVKGRL